MLRVVAGLMLLALAAAIVPSADRRAEVAVSSRAPAPDSSLSPTPETGPSDTAAPEPIRPPPPPPPPTASLAPTPEAAPAPRRARGARAPLTGQPVGADVGERPVLAVKVDNAPTARPQAGLQHADVVIVQPVEGTTRFVALYHTTDPGRLGPVRSGRFLDAELLPPFDPLLAMSGAAEPVRAALRDAGLPLYETGSADAWEIDTSRRSPHQVFVAPAALWDVAGGGDGARAAEGVAPPRAPVWAFDDGVPAAAERAGRVAWRYPGATGVVWRWDGRRYRWVRSQEGRAQRTVDGTRVRADNVVVLRVPEGPNHTRPVRVVGSGELVLLRDGRRLSGTWHKPSRGAHFTWRDEDGEPLPLRPGTTWIELVREDAPVTVEAPEPPDRVPSAS